MQCPTKEKCITPFTRDNQTKAINHTTNMLGETHKGITNPTIRLVARFPTLPAPAYGGTFQPSGQQGNNIRGARPQQERPKFDPIPMTYTKLYPKLVQLDSLVSVDIPPMQPPYPDGATRMPDVITILVIECTRWKAAPH